MAGIARKNGSVLNPASFASGYSMVVLLVEANSNQFTADSGGGTTAITEGGFTKAIRSIQNIASMVYVGERANDQFVVIVDGPTAQPTGEAFNSDATPTAPAKSDTKSSSVQCSGTTKAGNRCKRITTNSNGRCYQHGGN